MRIEIAALVAVIAVVGEYTLSVQEAHAGPGSGSFYPSPEQPVGWRTDWTGRTPDAMPPVKWGRWLTGVFAETRAQAVKPGGTGEGGVLLHDRNQLEPCNSATVTQWLALGVISTPDLAAAYTGEVISGEAKMMPDAGDMIGGLTWEKDAAGMLARLGQSTNQSAYLHTYLYSGTGGATVLQLNIGVWCTAWLNGSKIFSSQSSGAQSVSITLQKGWNNLLLKLCRGTGAAAVTAKLLPTSGDYGRQAYKSENIAWMVHLPLPSAALPVVVGNNIFVTMEAADLVCVDKRDGKIRWIRSNQAYEILTDEEKALPQYQSVSNTFARSKVVHEQIIKMSNASNWVPGGVTWVEDPVWKEHRDFEMNFPVTLSAIDSRFKNRGGVDVVCPWWASPTPCSDGSNVYAYFCNGVLAAYDMDGNRKWIAYNPDGGPEHGAHSSPTISAGKVITIGFQKVAAFNCATGQRVWDALAGEQAGGSLVPAKANGVDVVVGPSGTILRSSDGVKLSSGDYGLALANAHNVGTPVIAGNRAYQNAWASGKYVIATFPEEQVLKAIPFGYTGRYFEFPIASPLVNDGLVYFYDDECNLGAFDTSNTYSLVYCTQLDLVPGYHYGASASPAFAGNHLYAWDSTLGGIVFEPGRQFKQIARNVIENRTIMACGHYNSQFLREEIWSTPVFDGGRIYLRGTEYLYCVGEIFHVSALPAYGGSSLILSWVAASNTIPFGVQRCTNLLSGKWEMVEGNIQRSYPTNTWQDPSPSITTPNFYRVVVSTNAP